MLPNRQKKIDLSKLSPEDQKLFKLYGKLPTGKDILNRSLKERKYFDSHDSADLVSLQNSYSILKEQKEDLQKQLKIREDEVKWGKNQLEIKDNQIREISNERDENERKLTLSQKEVERIAELLNNLQITSNNKNDEIKKQRDKLQQKEREITELRARLGTLSPEQVLHSKIFSEEKGLDNEIRSMSLPRPTVMSLCDAYENLELAYRDNNRDNINTAKNNIKSIKQELFAFAEEKNLNTDDLHNKIYQSCEKLAKLR